ncbi:MAG TPA: hypothetical protein VMN36_16490 [Verrucomicrobiales bacterium]|nr:hypothetical protein [Verrucomicrobiales bacterium]
MAGLVLSALAAQPETLPPDEASFVRAVNLNGPALSIDGHPWDSGDSSLPDSQPRRSGSKNT